MCIMKGYLETLEAMTASFLFPNLQNGEAMPTLQDCYQN